MNSASSCANRCFSTSRSCGSRTSRSSNGDHLRAGAWHRDSGRRLADLRGKPVVLGAAASGITQLGRTVFSSLDIDIRPIFLEKVADGPAMLADGRTEAIWGAGVGWPAFVALAKSGGRFIGPSEPEIETILKKNASLQRVTLPAKSYPGQDMALPSVGSWSYVLA